MKNPIKFLSTNRISEADGPLTSASSETKPFTERLALRARRLFTRKLLERVSLVTIFFLAGDTVIADVGWTISGRTSMTLFLSDLLFLEGSAILAIGIYIAVAKAWSEPPKKTKPQQKVEQITVEDEDFNPSPRYSTLMMFVGVILIVLSIAVGVLLT